MEQAMIRLYLLRAWLVDGQNWGNSLYPMSLFSTDLSPVRLSQNVTRPSPEIVATHVCDAPRAFVPTQMYASRPNPRSSEHSKTA